MSLSSKQWPSMHSHMLLRGRLRVPFPSRANWMQWSKLARKYLFLSDHRSQTVSAWLILVAYRYSTVVYGQSWCQIHPLGGFYCFHETRVKPIAAQDSFVCWWGVVSELYSQGWKHGDQMVALPIALTSLPCCRPSNTGHVHFVNEGHSIVT